MAAATRLAQVNGTSGEISQHGDCVRFDILKTTDSIDYYTRTRLLLMF